jgi:hypothetical protein
MFFLNLDPEGNIRKALVFLAFVVGGSFACGVAAGALAFALSR